MEPPLKRPRLNPSLYGDEDDENQDELSMTPAQFDSTQDPMYQLDKGRAKAATRLKSTFEDIFAKYGKDFDGDDDVINFYTDEIEVDNGHLQSLDPRKEGNPEDSLSCDEEDRILSGKQSGRQKKSRSKSLVPTNYASYTQRQQFPSPWNEPLGLGAPRLSSLAFSSYGAPPPFDLGPFAFGNTHVDPVWQTPDLPFQIQQRSAMAIGHGQSGLFGGLSDYAPKRLVSAKSLLRTASTQPRARSAAVQDEEDNIVLGRNRQGKTPSFSSQDREKVDIPGTATSGSRSSNSLPAFSGLGIDDDELNLAPDDNENQNANKHEPKGPSAADIVLAARQSADEGTDTSHCKSSSSSPKRLSPIRRKRRRSKKSNTQESSQISDESCNSDPRTLQPHERRIEVVIPIMKHLLQPTREQSAEEPASLIGDSPQQSDEAHNVLGDHTARITPPPSDHEDEEHQSPEGVTEVIQDILEQLTARSCGSQETSQEHSMQAHERIDLPEERSPLPHKDSLEDTIQQSSSLQKDTESLTDEDNTTAEDCPKSGQMSNCDTENDDTIIEQQLYIDINDGISRAIGTLNTNDDGSIEEIQAIEDPPIEASVHPISPKEILEDEICEDPIEAKDLLPADTLISETARPQEESSSPSEHEDTTEHEPASPVLSCIDDDLQSTCSFRCNSTLSLLLDERANGAPEQEVDYQSPEYSVTYTMREYYESLDRDRPSPNFLSSEVDDGEKIDGFDEPMSQCDLVAEIDTLQLEPDDREVERNCSPDVVELPDQDLSVFPTGEPASNLASPPSFNSIENDDQDDNGMGRSPSPELGTPVRSKASHSTAAQTNTSPTPTTPTRKQSSKAANRSTSTTTTYRRTPSSKRFPLTSLLPEGIDDESDDELSMTSSITSTGGSRSRLFSPFFRPSANDNYDLPPLLTTPRNRNRKLNYLIKTPSSSSSIRPPATTDSRRTGRSQTRRRWQNQNQNQNRAVNSSPLKRRVAERLLLNNSSPLKKQGQRSTRSSPSVAIPSSPTSSTSRRCGEDGFECGRDFCFTCCI